MSEVVRLHIGNISTKLAENPENLSKRIERFGTITSPLEVRSKPVNTHHFGFISVEITPKNLQLLISSLNKVLFMGLKLSVSKAKADYKEAWKKDQESSVEEASKDRVHNERLKRIKEYTSTVHRNPITDTITGINQSNGYSKSAHVFLNKSANTKHSAPTQTLIGSKSYGALTGPSKFYDQRHAYSSGGGDIIRGRIRKTPRSKDKLKNQTLRILINGSLKQIKAYKTKLWGFEKNKTSRDLTWSYSNGVWKSGDEHVLERVDRCGITGAQAINYGKDLDLMEVEESTADTTQEQSKSLAVLASMFANNEFDKPVELDDEEEEVEVDSKGRKKAIRFDYETEGTLYGEESVVVQDVDTGIIEEYKSQADMPQQEVYYDESDEGNELDFDQLGKQYSTETIAQDYIESHQEDVDKAPDVLSESEHEEAQDESQKAPEEPEESSEEEFMPSFGAQQQDTNNTEALRSLFNPQESSLFSLGVSNDDIDEYVQVDQAEQKQVLKQIKEKQQEEEPEEQSRFGLFWSHEESPFLQTQTQLSKLGYANEKIKLPGEELEEPNDPEDETPYEKWFWKMRGEVSRECKRRRRDVLRVLSKKSDLDMETSEKPQELPEFTFKNVMHDIYDGINAILFDPHYKVLVGPVLVFASSIGTKIVISKIPYTEIDFNTYMQQIEVINEGELDYSLVMGDTGPIVYPAGFVQIYQILYWLTDKGSDILSAQVLFGYLFTGTLILSMLTYTSIKPWVLVLLLASKRLVSIYVLRLFNDCFTTAAMIAVTLILQQTAYWYDAMGSTLVFLATIVAADLFSIAISIKMNALLYLPGFMVVIYFLNRENIFKSLVTLSIIPVIQVIVGWKFLVPMFNDEVAKYLRNTYIKQAFKFDRKFLYEWTVNWRFVDEETFLSDKFSNALLIGHVSVLAIFIFTRYLSPKVTGKPLTTLIKDGFKLRSTISPQNAIINKKTGPRLVMLILSTSNVIGVLFARSLHYQFLSWYCWQLPFLLYTASPYLTIPLWIAHEYCWNVFPSTTESSLVLVGTLAVTLVGVWNNFL